MTHNLRRMSEMEERIHRVCEIKFDRPRFEVISDRGTNGVFEAFELAKLQLEGFLGNGKVMFVHEDGTKEDFTEYFI